MDTKPYDTRFPSFKIVEPGTVKFREEPVGGFDLHVPEAIAGQQNYSAQYGRSTESFAPIEIKWPDVVKNKVDPQCDEQMAKILREHKRECDAVDGEFSGSLNDCVCEHNAFLGMTYASCMTSCEPGYTGGEEILRMMSG